MRAEHLVRIVAGYNWWTGQFYYSGANRNSSALSSLRKYEEEKNTPQLLLKLF